VRLRKAAKGETRNETMDEVALKMQASQGVPLQIVAALCLLHFFWRTFSFKEASGELHGVYDE